MSSGIESAIDSVIGDVQAIDNEEKKIDSKLLNELGDEILGPTAESETKDAPVIAPVATITPVNQGRRSHRPDGQDPFHNVPASKP